MRTISPSQKLLLTERSFITLSLLLAGYQAWINRLSMMSDGISYLDVGDAYLRGDWKTAINAYWSPAYSLLLGAAMRVLKPPMHWEFPVVHLVNFIVFCLALFSFRYFVRAAIADSQEGEFSRERVSLPAWISVALSYTVFLWSLLALDDLILVTPDLLLAALVFCLGGLLLKLRLQHSLWRFLAFGSVCALAYLTKAIMFPLSFIFLAILLFSGAVSKRRIVGFLLATFTFLLTASPFILALSKSKGRLTYGDTGRLAYAGLVSPQAPQTNWQGDPVGSGIPVHPTRRVLDDPPVFEYAEPIGGTYPPWYDPSYWNEGVRPSFRFRSQARVLVQSFLTYGTIFQGYTPLVAALIFFLLLGKQQALNDIARDWPLLVISLIPAGVYALVLVKPRYVAAFAAVFFIAIIARIRLPRDVSDVISTVVGATVVVTMLASLTFHLAGSTYQALTVGHDPLMSEQPEVVQGLRAMGLQANDDVAVLGQGETAYWARLGKFKIVAEISDPSGRAFWATSPEMKKRAYELVRRSHAKAIVVWDPPEIVYRESWRKIGATHYYAYALQ